MSNIILNKPTSNYSFNSNFPSALTFQIEMREECVINRINIPTIK